MMVGVLLLMGLSFRSVVAPIRAIFCLAWMLVVTYGIAVYVFQDGYLNVLGEQAVASRKLGGMSWMSPIFSFSVLVGLGLDYDIFFTEGVLEECEHGYDPATATLRALA